MAKNELVLIDKIEKRLKEKREPVIFPLTPTHRKELRDLKNKNLGELKERLRIVRQLKQEEYIKIYGKQIQMIFEKHEKYILSLNDDWQERIKDIQVILDKRKEIEEKAEKKLGDMMPDLQSGYSGIAVLKLGDNQREYTLDSEKISKKIANSNFQEKYSKLFEKINEQIVDLETKYEEAINFGDLEIVKELYYLMKGSDVFFEKIDNLQI